MEKTCIKEMENDSIKHFISKNRVYILSIIFFLIVGSLNIKAEKFFIGILSLSLIWIFIYFIGFDKNTKSDDFINMLRLTAIGLVFLFIFDIAELGIENKEILIFIIYIINISLNSYLIIINKKSKLKYLTIVLGVMVLGLACLVKFAFNEVININLFILMCNLVLVAFNVYNIYFILLPKTKYYNLVETLIYIASITTVLIMALSINLPTFIDKLTTNFIYLLLYSYIYYAYFYSSKKIALNPYLKLLTRNNILNKNSEQLNGINTAIQKEITIQNKIKDYLEQRKELLNKALENMPCILIIADYKFNIVYTNKIFKQNFKYKVNSFYEIIEIIDKGKIKVDDWMSILKKEKIYRSRIEIKKNIYSLSITKNESDNTYLIALNDITNEVKMSKEIQEINENYAQIILNNPYPVVVRTSKLEKNDVIISVNRKFEEVFGFTYKEMKDISVSEYLNMLKIDFFDNKECKRLKSDTDSIEEILYKSCTPNGIVNLVLNDKDGIEHIEEASIGTCIYENKEFKLLTLRNIESEIEIFKKLNYEKIIYQDLIDSIPEAILLENLETSDVIYTNKAFKKLFEIEDNNMDKICQKYRNKIMKKYINNIHIGEQEKSLYLVNEKNEIKEIELISKIIVFDGKMRNVRIIKDVGAQKKLDKIKKILIRQREYDKMKMEFYTNMSHELKTPLNNIYSSLQLIENLYKKNKISDKQNIVSNHIKITKQNMFRLLRLIENIINISQVKSDIYKVKAVNFDIIDITERIVQSISEYANSKNIDLIFDTEEEIIQVGLDPEAIERIILNLLSNAIKFTKDGGKILINIKKINNEVEISVKDDGIGIEKEKLIEIFERFKQIENSDMENEFGSGIGLFLTKSLVEIQHGKINIDSELGKGTEVQVSFPIKEVQEKILEDVKYNSNIEKFEIEFFDIYK